MYIPETHPLFAVEKPLPHAEKPPLGGRWQVCILRVRAYVRACKKHAHVRMRVYTQHVHTCVRLRHTCGCESCQRAH